MGTDRKMRVNEYFGRIVFVTLLPLILLGTTSSRAQTDVNSRLCQHIVQDRQKIYVDSNKDEVVWSDGGFMEVGTNFPPDLEALILKPTRHLDLNSTIAQLNAGMVAGWSEAVVRASPLGKGCSIIQSMDGGVSVTVASIYIEYLSERYPASSIRIKSETEPTVFLVAGKVQAAIMPLKQQLPQHNSGVVCFARPSKAGHAPSKIIEGIIWIAAGLVLIVRPRYDKPNKAQWVITTLVLVGSMVVAEGVLILFGACLPGLQNTISLRLLGHFQTLFAGVFLGATFALMMAGQLNFKGGKIQNSGSDKE